MDHKPLNIAIVGCGNIARAYGKSLQPYPQLKLLGATDYVLKLAEDYVATFGGKEMLEAAPLSGVERRGNRD